MSSLVYFTSVLQFSEYRSLNPLGRFIPKDFIAFDVIINGIILLIYLSDSLSIMYTNATDFHILMYPQLYQIHL